MTEQATMAPQAPTTVKSNELKDGPTVTMNFPHPVLLTVDRDHEGKQIGVRRIHFREGAQQVPAHLADHPYLKANKVTRYQTGPTADEQERIAEAQRAQLQAQADADAAKKKADEGAAEAAAEAARIAQQQADDAKRQADADQVADATESARTGKPVEQIRKERETKAGKAKVAK